MDYDDDDGDEDDDDGEEYGNDDDDYDSDDYGDLTFVHPSVLHCG